MSEPRNDNRTKTGLIGEIAELRVLLDEAEQTLDAIRSGSIDALVVSGPQGEQLFSLNGAEHVYRVIIEAMNEGALTMDLGGYILFCNRRFCELVKRPMEEIVGKRFTNFAGPTQQPAIRALVADAQAGPVRRRLFLQAGGMPLSVQLSANLLVAATPPCICMVVSDLTELEASANSIRVLCEHEQALEESQAEFRRQKELLQVTMRSIGDAVIAIDGEGRISFLNPAAAGLTGWTEQEAIGRPVQEVFHLIDETTREPGEDIIARALREGRAVILANSICLIARDGREIPIEDSAAPIRDKDGRLLGAVLVFHDSTEKHRRQKAQATDLIERTRVIETLNKQAEQLEETNKELESFSYSVSHDLRAPLRAIDGYARMILRKHADKFDDDARRQFDTIRESTHMMGQLIDDLLAFSRAGRAELSTAPMDIGEMIREVWEEIKAANPDRRLMLKIAAIPPCRADRGLIKQVLINILSNAAKFTRGREEALIEAGGEVRGSECSYFIRDNGIGFDMQYHDKLFGVFQRLHSSGEFEGTGVGLAIVQRIIRRHGGRIWAESRPDEGATFYFVLPAGGV